MSNKLACIVALLCLFGALGARVPVCQAAEVIVVGDLHLKPVVDTISGIRKACRGSLKSFTPSEVQGRLGSIYEREGAKVVVALGMNALSEALSLPVSIPVIYGLVVTPPVIVRGNTTGFYIATPVSEYAELVKRIGSISRLSVVGTDEQLHWLARDEGAKVHTVNVKSAFEFITTINQLGAGSALLLLPDVSLLTATAMEQAYTLSFRKNIPILGVSEKHVKQGALLALVFEPFNVGRQIGEHASKVLKRGVVGQLPPSPPRKFELFVNMDTARKMGIRLPEDLVNQAKRLYP